jgi:DNA-directed RNA polymerase specialized sigma24 family protein
MTHETNLQLMTVEDLAQRCAQETNLYFKKLEHDTKFCFELFRRAILERSNSAWEAIRAQYTALIAKWVNRWADRHPEFPLASQEQEDFIEDAFIRFWHSFTPEKFGRSQGLEAILEYLKMCVFSSTSDTWRKMGREQFDQSLDVDDEREERGPAEDGPTPEEAVQNDELWQFIKIRLKDDKEYAVVYASFHLGLSPRQIIAEYPKVFRGINEVYQCKANVWARLARDPDLRKLLNLDD